MQTVSELFQRYDPAIRALISRHVYSRQDADDMYQNLYLCLVRRPPPHQTHILAYLSKVIRNHATDTARCASSRYGRIMRYGAMWRDHMLDKEPEDILVQIEQVKMITDQIESMLPPHIAQAILDRYLYDRSIGETAARLGVNERTVSHYCCTGLKEIRHLAQEGKFQVDALGMCP